MLLLDKKQKKQKKTTKKHTHKAELITQARNEEPESVTTGPAEGTAVFTPGETHEQRSRVEVYDAAVSHSLVGIVTQGSALSRCA